MPTNDLPISGRPKAGSLQLGCQLGRSSSILSPMIWDI